MDAPDNSDIEAAMKKAEAETRKSAKPAARLEAQNLLTKQLIHEIRENTKATNDLEATMDTYATWSRGLTIGILFLSAILVAQGFGVF